MFRLCVIVAWTHEIITCLSTHVFPLWYCTNTNVLYNQTYWITEELEHGLEKGSAYRRENRRYNGKDVMLMWRHLKKW